MGLVTFLKNLKYLFRYNIKAIKDFENFKNNDFPYFLNTAIDNLVYEIPEMENRIKNLNKPKIFTDEQTIDELIKGDKSLCRFGDGEMSLMLNQSIPFQPSNKKLTERLIEVFHSSDENIMKALPRRVYYPDLINVHNYVKFIDRIHLKDLREKFATFVNNNTNYYSAGITFPFLTYQNFNDESYYIKLQKLWRNKDITIICGHKTFDNIRYNIFDCAKSIEYQYAPSKNAFDKYDEIFNNAKENSQNRLIIIILGPTATVLAYDLAQHGIRALDLGHIAKDYNAYMSKMDIDANSTNKFFAPEE